MKKLVRKIVNWAYGCDIAVEILHLQQASKNLGVTLEDALRRLTLEIVYLNINKVDKKSPKVKKSVDSELSGNYSG